MTMNTLMSFVCLVSIGAALASNTAAEITAAAALPGEPHALSAAGVTRTDEPLLTIENPAPFDTSAKRRFVIIGGIGGDVESANAVVAAVRWFKTRAPASVRRDWSLAALPLADPNGRARSASFRFPPDKGFFDDPQQPESRYVWRWAMYQTPDVVVLVAPEAEMPPVEESVAALSSAIAAAGAPVELRRPSTLLPALPRVLTTHTNRSRLHDDIAQRVARDPLAVARVLARRYPAAPAISYIPSVAWINTRRLASLIGDDSLRARVREQIAPWIAGEKTLFGERIQLTAVAGTMIFADLAQADDDAAARRLALDGATLASAMRSDGVAQHGQGWTDDMFMTAAILARTGLMPGRERDLETAARLLADYAMRLQRPDGIFIHATDGPVAWGRGNGFAALGLMEALTALPAQHPMRPRVLEIYRRHMRAVKTMQAPDGMWRQIIDEPGSYREETATAMLLSSMMRGVRLGWIDTTYAPSAERAWRALAAHIGDDGTLVDVCTGTGAGPTTRYYLDRPALSGADDRGGAMALLASMEMAERRARSTR